jgi:4-amino-4-deoxy-L-arabinose transferase-like glycosyltransferase
MLLAGGSLRLWAPQRMAVEHFDEGVYASNLWFDAEADYQYPNRPLYAPPLAPFLIECSLIGLGPNGVAPMAPSLLAGCATILLVWWTSRQWFGVAVGVAAAALAAFSELHILYSRAALTDVLLCFWLLLSLGLAELALRRVRFDFAVAAGIAAGLAWWTKYNGWLAAATAFGGMACWIALQRTTRTDAKRKILVWCVIAIVAVVVWSPVWIGLQSFPGGYGAVAANHGKYVVGLHGWLASAKTQIAALRALDGGWSIVGLGVGLVGGALVVPPITHHQDPEKATPAPPTVQFGGIVLSGSAVLSALAMILGPALFLALFAATGLTMRIYNIHTHKALPPKITRQTR